MRYKGSCHCGKVIFEIEGDLSAGASVFIVDYAKLDFVFTWRSEEFVGQGRWHRFGGLNLSFRLP